MADQSVGRKRLQPDKPLSDEGQTSPGGIPPVEPPTTEQPETVPTVVTDPTDPAAREELQGEQEVCSLCGMPTEPPEECDHQPFVLLTVALGVLALILALVTVLLAVRCRKLKKRRRRRKLPTTQTLGVSGGEPQPEAEPETQPAPGLQVGKLHQLGDRESQQDCLAVSPEALYGTKGILAVVADGMGGLADGDKMSQAAASAMMNGFIAAREIGPDTILALTAEANRAVDMTLGPGNRGRSGTTLVAGIVWDGLFHYVSVGDSRICLYRQGLLTQLNREHIYRNELRVQAINGLGTLWDANTHPKAAGLTSYLGMGELKYVDIPAEPVRLCAGDKIILMSDGVYNAMTLPELEEALALPAQQAADTIGATIQAKAFRHQDNYTAVILQF